MAPNPAPPRAEGKYPIRELVGLSGCVFLLYCFNLLAYSTQFVRPDYASNISLPDGLALAVLYSALAVATVYFFAVVGSFLFERGIGLLMRLWPNPLSGWFAPSAIQVTEGVLGILLTILLGRAIEPPPPLPVAATPTAYLNDGNVYLFLPLKRGNALVHQWDSAKDEPFILIVDQAKSKGIAGAIGDSLISIGRFASTSRDSILARGTYAGRADVAVFTLPQTIIGAYLSIVPFVGPAESIRIGACHGDCQKQMARAAFPLVDALENFEHVAIESWTWRFRILSKDATDDAQTHPSGRDERSRSSQLRTMRIEYWERNTSTNEMLSVGEDRRRIAYSGIGLKVVVGVFGALIGLALAWSVAGFDSRRMNWRILALVLVGDLVYLSSWSPQPLEFAGIQAFCVGEDLVAFEVPMVMGSAPIHRWPSDGLPKLGMGDGTDRKPYDGVFIGPSGHRALFMVPAREALGRTLALKPQVHLRSHTSGNEERLEVRYAMISAVPEYWGGYPNEDSWLLRLDRALIPGYLAVSRADRERH